jgi:hypothetical protein
VNLSSDSRSLTFCLHDPSQGDDDIYVMINAYWEELEFRVQEGAAQEWKRIVDTALPSPDDFSDYGVPLEQTKYRVAPRSIVVLLRPRGSSRRSGPCIRVSWRHGIARSRQNNGPAPNSRHSSQWSFSSQTCCYDPRANAPVNPLDAPRGNSRPLVAISIYQSCWQNCSGIPSQFRGKIKGK